MSSTRFTVNLDEITFVLFDQLKMDQKLAGLEEYADFDREVYEATLAGGKRISEDVLAPINRPGDQAGCTVDEDGNVKTPEGYKAVWDQLADGGWIGVSAPLEFGGGGMPFVMSMALYEGFIGASVAFMMYPGLSVAAARVISKHGPEDKRALWATKMFTGEWGGTMCLTEAGAGSSVGDNRARATPTDEPGVYHIEGEKIFISAGDHDMVENIVHLVLARTPNAGKGTKGLSLFMVPKLLVDDEAELQTGEGDAPIGNNAKVLRIEHKMGINGSATCVMGFGAGGPCRGWLLGQENQGIELMFLMMNEARIGVAAQGMAIGAAAYNYSLHYANERVQGSALREMRNADAPRVTIVNHPDVRRMLMTQKVYADTMRSLCCRVALMSDLAEHIADEEEKRRLSGRVDLLTPILKSMCTDVGYEMATLAVQVYGGYGYVQEYPVEQLVRDSKIFSIYEGTNGIQAMDLLGRKMRIGSGALFIEWMQESESFLRDAAKAGFIDQSARISKAVQSLAATAMHLANVGRQRNIEGAMLQASPFLRMFGYVLLAIEAIDQAMTAKRVMAERGESPLLKAKLPELNFFVNNVLPLAIATGKGIQSGDESCLEEHLFQV